MLSKEFGKRRIPTTRVCACFCLKRMSPLGLTGTIYSNSRFFHGRCASSQGGRQSCAEFSNRMRNPPRRHRGGRHRDSENDGREHAAGREFEASTHTRNPLQIAKTILCYPRVLYLRPSHHPQRSRQDRQWSPETYRFVFFASYACHHTPLQSSN